MNKLVVRFEFQMPTAQCCAYLAQELLKRLKREAGRSKMERTIIPHVDDRFRHYLKTCSVTVETDDADLQQHELGGLPEDKLI